MNVRAHHPKRGFTLLEIMVALSLFSLIVIAIYSSWNAIVKGAKVGREAAAAAQRTRIAMRTVQDALLCACMYNQNGRYYYFASETEGDYSSLSFVAQLPNSYLRSSRFGDLDVRRVTFTVEDGPDSSKQLVLRQNPILLDVDEDENNFPLVLARNVHTFLVEFTDPRTGDWVSEWTATNVLPRKVRVTLALKHPNQDSDRAQEVLVATVALPSQPIRVEWQAPPGALNPGGLPGARNPGTTPGSNPGVNPGANPGVNPGNFPGGMPGINPGGFPGKPGGGGGP